MNKVIKNASWIIVCRLIQVILSFVITMLTARFLGPSNYGILNYAISVTAFFVPIALLGINSTLVQEIVTYPEEEGKILGSSLTMGLFSSLFCVFGVILFANIVNSNDSKTIVVCGMYAVVMIFQGMEMIQYWFQAKLLSKYTSIVSLIAYVIVSVYKILLLATGMDVEWFALAYSIDYFIISAVLIFLYCRRSDTQKLQFSKTVACRIINKSKYYIVSALMVTLFAQQDKVMIKLIVGNEATGFYSAAVSIVTMSGFIFTAIIDSFRPVIYEAKYVSLEEYEESITKLYSIIIYMCILQGLLFTLLAKAIIHIVYGTSYYAAIPVLQILVWYTSFSYIGGIRDIWLLGEDKQKYLIWINLTGALVNMILNYVFISYFGICGAAIASLLTQIFTNIGLTFIVKPIQRNNYFISRAVNPKYVYVLAKTLCKNILIKR